MKALGLPVHHPLANLWGGTIDDALRVIDRSVSNHDPPAHDRNRFVDDPLHDRAHDGPDHRTLDDVAHDRPVLDHPPLDHRLNDASFGDAPFHDPALDDTILVVLDLNMASSARQIVLIFLDHPTLDAWTVEIIRTINQGIAASKLSLSGRGRHQGRPAKHHGCEASKGQDL